MTRWAAQLGITLPGYAAFVSAAVALVIVFLVWLVAVFAGRTIGHRLSDMWERQLGTRTPGMAERMCDFVRYAVAAILFAIALRADAWPPLSAFILGFSVAAATALLVRSVVRGLNMPAWVALLLASAAFVALLANALNGLKPVTDILDLIGFNVGDAHLSLLTVVQAAIIVLALYAAVKLTSRVLNQSIRRARTLDATQQLLAQKLGSVVVLVAAFFIGIDLIGIDLTALTVFSGALGLAVGFGLQKTFGNLIAGIILLMDRSIKPGDVIVVGDSVGYVNKIGVRAVSILTRDGKEHLIPNENLMTQEVENWSYSNPNVRVHIPVTIAFDCDVALAQKLMIEAAAAPERVLKVPKPNVWLRKFAEGGLEHDILVWIKDPEAGLGNVQSEVLNRLWALFREHGISLPNPQRDLHIREWPAGGIKA